MTRFYAVLAVLALIAGLAWAAMHYRARAQAAEALAAGYADAIRIRQESDRKQAELRAQADALDRELDGMEGADAPLSDYLGRAAGRVWP